MHVLMSVFSLNVSLSCGSRKRGFENALEPTTLLGLKNEFVYLLFENNKKNITKESDDLK